MKRPALRAAGVGKEYRIRTRAERTLFRRLAALVGGGDRSPLWAVRGVAKVVWVPAGQAWTVDATACPACTGSITFGPDGWACERCDLRRPAVAAPVHSSSDRLDTTLLPAQNRANPPAGRRGRSEMVNGYARRPEVFDTLG